MKNSLKSQLCVEQNYSHPSYGEQDTYPSWLTRSASLSSHRHTPFCCAKRSQEGAESTSARRVDVPRVAKSDPLGAPFRVVRYGQ